MTVPIVNDWKAIRDRMQQIQAEESSVYRPCPLCQGIGWLPDLDGPRRGIYRICVACQNSKGLPRPVR